MDLTILLAILLIIGLAMIILLALALMKNKGGGNNDLLVKLVDSLRNEINNSSTQNRQEIQQKFDILQQHLNKSSHDNFQAIQTQFKQSSSIIKEVTDRLAKIDETNKQVLDFSGQMQSLENILKNPKQRGILGEYFLETLLGNVLQPNQYQMQYKFSDGEVVDAAIFYRDKVIPIDAKFSLEKYNKIMETTDQNLRDQLEKEFRQDVKNRIDETAKYIKPRESTTEFAFMFIPAEGVYYNLLIYNVGSVTVSMQDLIEYAFKKHVIIVSPTSFFAYLETVLQGLKSQKVEENIKEIINRIGDLGKHLANYQSFMEKLGKNLSTTVVAYNTASKEFKKVDKDIYKLTDGESGGEIEALLVDKPADDSE
jgi:DNA recombination protein RmuC